VTPIWRCAIAGGKLGRVAGHHGSVPFPAACYSPAPAPIKRFVLVCVYSDPMEAPEGITDKLYWRKGRGQWHCFKKLAQARGYVSLCERQEIALVLGQQISRPEADLRCGVCDGLEMELRGWRGSGPVSPRRARSLNR
jgi:hypothetical protein